MSDGKDIDPVRVEKITRDASGKLVAHVSGGETVEDVRVSRCFPWTLPGSYISVYEESGKELTLLGGLDELDDESRRIVEDQLDRMVFTPQIKRIVEHRREFGVTSITAETDRGDVTFQIRNRNDVRVFSPTRAVFRDADGNAYEVADLDALDAKSKGHIAPYF